MPAEPYPQSPTYLSYIFNLPTPHSNGPVPRPRPHQPASQLTCAELELQGKRGVYEHFHAPYNDYNRFLAKHHWIEGSGLTATVPHYIDRERMPPHPWDQVSGGHWPGADLPGLIVAGFHCDW